MPVAAQGSASRRMTGIAGLAAVILFAGGNALWGFDQPRPGAPPGEITAFYADASSRIIVGGSISLIAVTVFVFFASGVRVILRDLERDGTLANAALGGALIVAATGLGAETINMVGAQRADDGELTQELGQALFDVSYALGYNAAGVGAGIFALALAGVALRTRALLPRWGALLTLAVGLAFLTPLAPYVLGPALLLLAMFAVQLIREPAMDDARSAGDTAPDYRPR